MKKTTMMVRVLAKIMLCKLCKLDGHLIKLNQNYGRCDYKKIDHGSISFMTIMLCKDGH